MRNQSAARKVQEVIPTMTIVEPTANQTSAKVINFKASAEEVPSEPIDQEAAETETQAKAEEQAKAEAEEQAKAEEAATETETVSIFEVIEKVNAEYNSGERILPSEAARRAAEEQPTPIIIEKPKASIEEIKRKNEVLSRLTAKYDALSEKRRRVEDFEISHDGDTANVRVRDAQGEVFESNSPKTIGKLVEFWKAEFSEALAQVENEIREIA